MLRFLYRLVFASAVAAWVSFIVAIIVGPAIPAIPVAECFLYIGFTYSGAAILSWLLYTMIAPPQHTIYKDV